MGVHHCYSYTIHTAIHFIVVVKYKHCASGDVSGCHMVSHASCRHATEALFMLGPLGEGGAAVESGVPQPFVQNFKLIHFAASR